LNSKFDLWWGSCFILPLLKIDIDPDWLEHLGIIREDLSFISGRRFGDLDCTGLGGFDGIDRLGMLEEESSISIFLLSTGQLIDEIASNLLIQFGKTVAKLALTKVKANSKYTIVAKVYQKVAGDLINELTSAEKKNGNRRLLFQHSKSVNTIKATKPGTVKITKSSATDEAEIFSDNAQMFKPIWIDIDL
jgi:hypothetical protein